MIANIRPDRSKIFISFSYAKKVFCKEVKVPCPYVKITTNVISHAIATATSAAPVSENNSNNASSISQATNDCIVNPLLVCVDMPVLSMLAILS